tara:strand:+ start:6389 stop:6649 length:261 start_codon:yes stop_codon:yes gene_type:complete
MKHNVKLNNIIEAKAYLEALVKNDLSFHLDDDPKDIIYVDSGKRLFSDKEAEQIVERVEEMYSMDWKEYECPIGYLLSVEEVGGQE